MEKYIKDIQSSSNDQFKYLKSLGKSKGLKASHHFLLSGEKLIQEFLNDKIWFKKIKYVLISKSSLQSNSLIHSRINSWIESIQADTKSEASILRLDPKLFNEIDELGTGAPILVLEKPTLKPWSEKVLFDLEAQFLETSNQNLESKVEETSKALKSRMILFLPLGDPQNLGAVVRTAYAFGVSALVLLKESAHPFLPKAIKASSGAILKIPLFEGPSIKELMDLKTHLDNHHHYKLNHLVALDLKGEPLQTVKRKPNEPWLLLLGEEGQGVPENFKGRRIMIPMKNPMESLNVSVAAGIAIHALMSQECNY